MSEAPDILIQEAVAWVILQTRDGNDNPLVPQTVIAASHPITAGDTTVRVDPLLFPDTTPQFAAGGIIRLWDGTDEEDLVLADVSDDGTTLSPDFEGLGYAGFQFTHPAGTVISTNLVPWIPWDISQMLDLSQPVYYLTTLRERTHQQQQGGLFPLFTVHLQHHRILSRPGQTSTMPPDVWAQRQEKSARRDLATLRKALLRNSRLVTNTPAAAVQLGWVGTNTPKIETVWDKFEVTTGSGEWHFFATMDINVTGTEQRLR